MLWTALLVSQLARPDALGIFREVGKLFSHWRQDIPADFDIGLSGLSKLEPGLLLEILATVTAEEESKKALAPLLLFKDLPGKDFWERALQRIPTDDDWPLLGIAVAKTLGHQSEESTDCRWARVLCFLLAGQLQLPDEEMVQGYLLYPNYGDLRKVRPYIRSTEIALAAGRQSDVQWPEQFWSQCLADTTCLPLRASSGTQSAIVGTTPANARKVYELLLEHFGQTLSTTAVDPKHDTVFGLALYCLSLLEELLRVGMCHSVAARMALRAILECYITLAYLAQKDDPELWKSYRVFGAGQAKLQYLKLDELEANPSSMSIDALMELANEDVWEEFLDIELGHWQQSSLRDLSIEAGIKDVYDQYYPWPSSFVHGHWGSVRDSVYDTCGNPLHRLHRIPRKAARALPDVVPDACLLTDRVLEILSKCYPEFVPRVGVQP